LVKKSEAWLNCEQQRRINYSLHPDENQREHFNKEDKRNLRSWISVNASFLD
jgi:hypothetical protein